MLGPARHPRADWLSCPSCCRHGCDAARALPPSAPQPWTLSVSPPTAGLQALRLPWRTRWSASGWPTLPAASRKLPQPSGQRCPSWSASRAGVDPADKSWSQGRCAGAHAAASGQAAVQARAVCHTKLCAGSWLKAARSAPRRRVHRLSRPGLGRRSWAASTAAPWRLPAKLPRKPPTPGGAVTRLASALQARPGAGCIQRSLGSGFRVLEAVDTRAAPKPLPQRPMRRLRVPCCAGEGTQPLRCMRGARRGPGSCHGPACLRSDLLPQP